MSCFCNTEIVHNTNTCDDDCLLIRETRIGCDNGPLPCGEVSQVDLTEHNDVTASECPVIYTLLSYDVEAFVNVSITHDGILTFATTSNFVPHKEYAIHYKVNDPCSILSGTGKLFTCMKDACKGKNCESNCDKCTGDCEPLVPEIGLEGDIVNNNIKLK